MEQNATGITDTGKDFVTIVVSKPLLISAYIPRTNSDSEEGSLTGDLINTPTSVGSLGARYVGASTNPTSHPSGGSECVQSMLIPEFPVFSTVIEFVKKSPFGYTSKVAS